MRAYAIALDIDGTLEGFGGIINRKSIELMLRHAHVGIVSARSDCEKIAQDLGLGYACCAGRDKPSKAECLADYALKYPVLVGRIYIAETFWDVQALVELLSSIGLTSTCTHDEGANMVCDAVKPV